MLQGLDFMIRMRTEAVITPMMCMDLTASHFLANATSPSHACLVSSRAVHALVLQDGRLAMSLCATQVSYLAQSITNSSSAVCIPVQCKTSANSACF